MNKYKLFLLAMMVYYIIVVVAISKLFVIPVMKFMALLFFIGAGYLYSRKMTKKLQ